MRRMLAIGAVAVAVSGCAEHWYASDAVATTLRGPERIGVRVTTDPAAWPDDVYGDAVRAAFYDAGSVRLVDEGAHEVLQGGDDWVNVLDAWDGCDRHEVCVREFWFDVTCDAPCEGEFEVDAFLSTSPLPEPDRGGSITLELLRRPDGIVLGG